MARNVDEDREEIRELKSERYDQSTAHQLRPTEGGKMQFAGNDPDLQPGDETILPDRGRPAERTPGSAVGNHGVLESRGTRASGAGRARTQAAWTVEQKHGS